MNLKLLFKVLSFSFVASFAFADDCNEIKEYLENKSLNYTSTIAKCNMNDQGQVIELKVNNENLQEEDVNKILSYNSIKNLEYIVVFNEAEEQDSPYSHPLIPHPGFSEFPSIIANLPELEELKFDYNNFRYVKYFPEVNRIPIESLKLSKNLKKLTLTQVDLSNENLKELSTLSNLEEITFNKCSIDEDGFTSFENHEKLSKLSINNIPGTKKVIPSGIEKIKPLRNLRIDYGYCKGESYDFSSLDNLESLYINLTKECNIDLSNNEKLTELSIESHSDIYFDIEMRSPIDLKLPNSLKILTIYGLVFSTEDYNAVVSLSNLEELTMDHVSDDSNEYEIKSLKCHETLRKLSMVDSLKSKKNIDFE